MKTKQIFIALIMLLCISSIALFIQGCSNEESDATEFTGEQKLLIEKYAVVGIEHNDAMADIFNSLRKETKSTSILNGDDLAEIVKQKTEKVLQSKGYDTDLIDFDKFFNVNREKTKSAGEDYIASVIYNNNRSEQFKKIVKELVKVSDNYALSIQEHKNKVNQLNKLAFSTLNEEELGYFLTGSSTACASFEYWHNHLQEWCELLGGKSAPRLKSGGEDDFWNPYGNGSIANSGVCEGMVGSDLEGAIGGAMTGAVAGAPVLGVGAAAGALTGAVLTGVGASTGRVIYNIGGHLGWW